MERSTRWMPESEEDVLISEGQRVRHTMFGEGTVVGVDTDKGAHVVQFDGMSTPRKISFKAKLEKI